MATLKNYNALRVPVENFDEGMARLRNRILILYLGILPTRVLDWAAASISTIF
jgi:hypothetical protein